VGGFVESEIWPNLLAAARARHLPLMLVNARLSDRSFRGWRRLGGFAATQFGSFATVQAQSELDAERLRRLGARALTVPGNLKLAAPKLPADPAAVARLAGVLAGRPVWFAASTHPGEEETVIAAHDALVAAYPDVLTIIAPRHAERGPAVAALCGPRCVTRRGLGQDPPARGIWVADTMGELGLLYRLAGPVFVGGSLVAHGGQNVLEPARLGRPLAVGPHTDNFADAVATLAQAGGLARVHDADSLAAWVALRLADPQRAAAIGRAGAAAASPRPDLPGLVADALLALLPPCRP
jgi:3-deoxy-D-manno-octulosonic-acid transferase